MTPRKTIMAMLILTGSVAWADSCVLQERSVTQHRVVIQERSSVSRNIVPMPDGGKKCMVSLKVRVANHWHTAHGEHVWDGHRGSAEACAVAVSRAEDSVKQRIGQGAAISERVLICDDRPELQQLRNSVVGSIGSNHQFRPHPNHDGRFWHNGAQCRWFVEPALTDRGVHQFQGIVCELGKDQWVVVDKF